MKNVDSFSIQSGQYARHRPSYPAELFLYLGSLLKQRGTAWDCATGNGQAAVACAELFSRVVASDISAEQVRQGLSHPRVTYHVCSAEEAPFKHNSFDLVVVAQALHWFNLDRFYPQVLRVLKPGGIFAAWGYGFFTIEPGLDRIISKHLLEPLDPFWADGNRQLMSGYRNLPFPVAEIPDPPVFEMQVDWKLNELLGYLRTWSAVKRYTVELGSNPLRQFEERLRQAWNSDEEVKTIKMPLFLRAGRKAD